MNSPVIHSLVKALQRVSALGSLDEKTALRIVGVSANLLWSKGSLIFAADHPPEGMYIVLKGRVRVFEGDQGREEDVALMGPGDFFGEAALLLETDHTKSAQALEDSELMVVPRESFHQLLASDPELNRRIRAKLDERLLVEDTVQAAPPGGASERA